MTSPQAQGSQPTQPPLPPRPSPGGGPHPALQRAPLTSGYYGGYSGYGGGGGYSGGYSGYNGYSRHPGYGYNPLQGMTGQVRRSIFKENSVYNCFKAGGNRFIQLAEESSLPAFQSIESIVRAFG